MVTLLCRTKPAKYRLKARIPFQFDPSDSTDEWTKPLAPSGCAWDAPPKCLGELWAWQSRSTGAVPTAGSCRCQPGAVPAPPSPKRCPAGPGRRRRGPGRAGRPRGGTCGTGAVRGSGGTGGAGLGTGRRQRRGQPRPRRAEEPEPRARSISVSSAGCGNRS